MLIETYETLIGLFRLSDEFCSASSSLLDAVEATLVLPFFCPFELGCKAP